MVETIIAIPLELVISTAPTREELFEAPLLASAAHDPCRDIDLVGGALASMPSRMTIEPTTTKKKTKNPTPGDGLFVQRLRLAPEDWVTGKAYRMIHLFFPILAGLIMTKLLFFILPRL